jgi:hypothetical protein
MLTNRKLSSLFLSIKVNGATHKYERSIQTLLVIFGVKVFPGAQYHFVVNAFLFAIRIDAYVT